LEQTVTAVSFLLLAAAFGGFFIRMHRKERRESAAILGRMKGEFFPQLERNLNEVKTRLEAGGGECSSLIVRGLSAVLSLEFKLRFQREGKMLEELTDALRRYEADLSKAASHPEDPATMEKLKAQGAEIKYRLEELIKTVQALSKIERLPSRRPVIGH
jgi:hypothetical protein